MLHGVEAHEAAGLHVVDARAEDLVALATEPVRRLQRADRVDRVEMAEDQDPLLGLVAPGRMALQHVAEAVAPGRARDLRADAAQVALDRVDEAVHRRGVVAGRLDLDPAADAGEDLLGVEDGDVGTAGVVHGFSRALACALPRQWTRARRGGKRDPARLRSPRRGGGSAGRRARAWTRRAPARPRRARCRRIAGRAARGRSA